MQCFECGQDNQGQGFCSKCGWPLATKEYVARKINTQLEGLFSDRELIETASAARVFDKAWGWAKIHIIILSSVLALLSAGVVWKIVDFNLSVETAKQHISEKTVALDQVLPEMDKLRQQMVKTASDVEATQKILSSKENLIKDILSSHVYEAIEFKDSADSKFVILPKPPNSTATIVLFLLHSATIADSLQLQLNVFTQPPGSYWVFHNLVIIRWGDPISSLKNESLIASYYPDKGDSELIHSLTLKDGRAFADGEPLPKFNAPDPDFKGNKWGDSDSWKEFEHDQ